PHLINEVDHLPNLQVVVALGKIAWDAWMKLLAARGRTLPRPRPTFAHGAVWANDGPTLVGVYHPSRQNTNTGVLTPRMYDEVFRTVRRSLR
ncbi:MAG TPA: uracil-DNA glycosylase family protein, partial [Vicinamibacterales bacterium]|nr:uracil-DNA glycosylase family protein [Vicinamibacterales bacterium]